MITPLAALSPEVTELQKQAFLQKAIDGAWNATVKPMADAAGQAWGGIKDTVGGGAKALWNTAMRPQQTIWGGLKGAIQGGQKGGLGGFVQGAWDGGKGAWQNSMNDAWSGAKQMGGGLKNWGQGGLNFAGRSIAAPITNAYGAATGYGTYQDPNMNGYGMNATPKAPQPQPTAQPAPQAGAQPAAQQAQAATPPAASINLNQPLYGQLYKGAREVQIDEVIPPFAAFEKEAGAVGLIGKGIKGLGGFVSKATKSKAPLDWSKRFGHAMAKSPGLRKGINIGVPGAAGAGALYGSNRLGHGAGMEEGAGLGYDLGSQYGLQAAMANMPQDPGILGRILNVFRGQEAGPDPNQLAALLAGNRQNAIQTLVG